MILVHFIIIKKFILKLIVRNLQHTLTNVLTLIYRLNIEVSNL